jgi:peptide/nickel transport system substrate-binding protein
MREKNNTKLSPSFGKEGLMSNQFTRRGFLKGTVVGMAGMTGLGSFGLDLAEASPENIKRGGVWRIAKNMTIPTLDVHLSNEYFASVAGIYECLLDTAVDPKTYELKLVPMLAESWRFEGEGKRLIFVLRKGIRFHDGTRFDAKAAKWNLDRVRSLPKSYLKFVMSGVDNIEVINENTIAINCKAPMSNLPYALSTGQQWAGMISPTFHEKNGDDGLARNGCGTGPFRLKTWIVDEKVIVEKSKEYWKAGADGKPLPYLDAVEEHYRPQIDLAVVDLRSGNLDTVYAPATRDYPTIKNHPDLAYVEMPPFELALPCIGFNSRKGPFTSLALRQAACYALDRERFAKVMGFGIARVHQYPRITKGDIGWAPEAWPDYTHNPQKAKDLAKKAYPGGVTVKLSIIAREPDSTLGEMIKANWDAVGINTELNAVERVQWIEGMRKENFDASTWGSSTSMGGFLEGYLMSKAPANWSKMSIPKVDELLEKLPASIDRAKRHEIVKEALKTVFEAAEMTCAYAYYAAVGTRKYVKGMRIAYRHVMPHEVWLDK